MKSLKDVQDKTLNWVQPKAMHQFFELRDQNELFGTIFFPKSVGSLAEAEAFDGKWTFKRVGFFNTQITIRKFGEENNIAVFKPNLMATSGTIHFNSGNIFQWHTSNFWGSKFEFKDSKNETIIVFKSGTEEQKLKDWFKTQARVEIIRDKINLEELSLLILIGWYLIIVLQMDSSTSAVIAAAT
jgi:hypothetical protein